MKLRSLFAAMTGGAFLGLAASFIQTLEKIQLLKHSGESLVCDLNSVFSCTNVLNSWQSSVMGFPNSIMCLFVFTILLTAGLAGLAAGTKNLPKNFRLGMQGLSLAVLAFGLWYLSQTIFVIGALCIYCLFCMAGLLVVNWALLRANVSDLPISDKAKAKLKEHIAKGTDIFGWFLIAAAITLAILIQFR